MKLERRPVFRTLSPTGLFGAIFMLWVALSPSLLPRPIFATVATVSLSMAFGYLVGTIVHGFWISLKRGIGLTIRVRPPWGSRLRWGWFALLTILTLVSFVANAARQNQLEQLTQRVGVGAGGQILGTFLGAAGFLLMLVVARVFGWATRCVSHRLTVWFSPWLASLTAVVLMTVLVALLAEGAVIRPLFSRISEAAARINFAESQSRTQPTESTRSGSPASLESWESLGAQGQQTVSSGPRAAQIAEVTGAPAMEPIRVYAGLRSGQDIQATAKAVVAELDRTHAWDRKVLVLVTSAGKGFVQEWSLESVEYLTGGDCATASMQYSYLESGWAYIVDRESSLVAGKALYDAVYAKWHTLPEDERPKLYLNGESLGSYGGQGAFDSVQQMIDGVDGALWVGTPRFTPLWRDLTNSRELGSPEIAPMIDSGSTIRFVTSPDWLNRNPSGQRYAPWGNKRIVYLQHASDPVVWWSPELLWSEPDWMREGYGTDVLPGLTWMPWVTFWQLATDMPASATGAGGHGHQYHEELVPVWNAVLGTEVDDVELTRIRDAIAQS